MDDVRQPQCSEALAWSILSGLPGAAVIVFDMDLRVIAVAGAALGAWGFDRELMLGRRLADTLPAAAYAQYERHYLSALNGEASTLEADTFDGERICQTEFSPLRGGAGDVVGGIAASRDITDARRAQQALVASEHQFRELAEQATDLQARLAPDGTFLFASVASQRLLGYTPEELLGSNVHELMHPDELATVAQRQTEPAAADGAFRPEARLRHRDGSWRWCESTVRTVHDRATGEAVESHCSIRDITERRENEELRRHWEQTFNGTTRAICVADAETMVVQSVNPAFARMHGGEISDFVGRPTSISCTGRARRPMDQGQPDPVRAHRLHREPVTRADLPGPDPPR